MSEIKTYARRRGRHSGQFYVIHYSGGKEADKYLVNVLENGRRYLGKVKASEEWLDCNGYKPMPADILNDENGELLIDFLNGL